MIFVGLTGSIGMGKSTVTQMFADLGAATWDADAAVHRLYAKGGAGVALIAAAFPAAVEDGAVDRVKLAEIVLGAPASLRRLEDIVHPLVAQDRIDFLERAGAGDAEIAVLDIPLLFEKKTESLFDAVVVVSAPPDIQRARTLSRLGMTAEKFEAILAEQMPDAEKRTRADYVIETDRPFAETRTEVERVFADLKKRFGARPPA